MPQGKLTPGHNVPPAPHQLLRVVVLATGIVGTRSVRVRGFGWKRGWGAGVREGEVVKTTSFRSNGPALRYTAACCLRMMLQSTGLTPSLTRNDSTVMTASLTRNDT